MNELLAEAKLSTKVRKILNYSFTCLTEITEGNEASPLQHLFGERLVYLNERERALANLFAAQVEAANVDSMVADERGYAAKHARLVAIEQKKHVTLALRDGLQCETVDANYSHVTATEQRARHFALFALR